MILTVLMILGLMHTSLAQYQQPQEYDRPTAGYDNRESSNISPRSYGSASPEAQRPAPAQPEPKPTPPVAILKQINRHNEDGSYTYGFEGGDGSFKIETKLANGDVKGKYGFVDDTGKVRVVEYGANQYGFQPAGEGITVAPPTLIDDTAAQNQADSQQNYQEYDYPQAQGPQPAPPSAPSHAPAAARERTEAIYAREPAFKKPPIFAPAPPQSQLLRNPQYQDAPSSQANNQGPVQFNPAPVHEASLAHQRPQQGGHNPRQQNGGILDQLARDYALPQNSAPPLHDISFGYY